PALVRSHGLTGWLQYGCGGRGSQTTREQKHRGEHARIERRVENARQSRRIGGHEPLLRNRVRPCPVAEPCTVKLERQRKQECARIEAPMVWKRNRQHE